jgi:hypothetical protein
MRTDRHDEAIFMRVRKIANAHKSDLTREVRVSVVVVDFPSEVLRNPITRRHLEFQNFCCRD